MNNKINKSHLIVIVAVLCFVISGCSGGGTYVGEYKDDLFHGQGTMTYALGEQLEGVWEEGKFLYENKGK